MLSDKALAQLVLFAQYLSTLQLGVVQIIIRSQYIRNCDQNLFPISNDGLPLR